MILVLPKRSRILFRRGPKICSTRMWWGLKVLWTMHRNCVLNFICSKFELKQWPSTTFTYIWSYTQLLTQIIGGLWNPRCSTSSTQSWVDCCLCRFGFPSGYSWRRFSYPQEANRAETSKSTTKYSLLKHKNPGKRKGKPGMKGTGKKWVAGGSKGKE